MCVLARFLSLSSGHAEFELGCCADIRLCGVLDYGYVFFAVRQALGSARHEVDRHLLSSKGHVRGQGPTLHGNVTWRVFQVSLRHAKHAVGGGRLLCGNGDLSTGQPC